MDHDLAVSLLLLRFLTATRLCEDQALVSGRCRLGSRICSLPVRARFRRWLTRSLQLVALAQWVCVYAALDRGLCQTQQSNDPEFLVTVEKVLKTRESATTRRVLIIQLLARTRFRSSCAIGDRP